MMFWCVKASVELQPIKIQATDSKTYINVQLHFKLGTSIVC